MVGKNPLTYFDTLNQQVLAHLSLSRTKSLTEVTSAVAFRSGIFAHAALCEGGAKMTIGKSM